jgi:Selenocysteine synthase N terminal
MNDTLAKAGARRRLPSIDQVLQTSEAGEAIARFGRPMVKQAARDLLAEARQAQALLYSPG